MLTQLCSSNIKDINSIETTVKSCVVCMHVCVVSVSVCMCA